MTRISGPSEGHGIPDCPMGMGYTTGTVPFGTGTGAVRYGRRSPYGTVTYRYRTVRYRPISLRFVGCPFGTNGIGVYPLTLMKTPLQLTRRKTFNSSNGLRINEPASHNFVSYISIPSSASIICRCDPTNPKTMRSGAMGVRQCSARSAALKMRCDHDGAARLV